MRVFLVDDHQMMLDGVANLVREKEDCELVGSAVTMQEALDQILAIEVDLLISDYNLPDGDGLTLLHRLKKVKPDMKVIMLSMHDEAHLVKEILKEGVDGYVLKRDSHTDLTQAISAVAQGKKYMSDEINQMLINHLHQPDDIKLLTDREREVLKLIAQEYSNKMIAEALFISERTVETHRKNIFRKTQTSSLVGLIKFAYANNLI
ncbi:response regulator [Reichenbachiella sp.]|uniref:response regulator n=1 Tax=Reichenbachiella sp. TaxID=2184521 RepID=UPI003B5CC0FD